MTKCGREQKSNIFVVKMVNGYKILMHQNLAIKNSEKYKISSSRRLNFRLRGI
jgi:hypothetical protein